MSRKSKRTVPPDSDLASQRKLAARIAELEEELTIATSKLRIRDLEIAELSAVVARNLKRVQAESDMLTLKGE